MSCGRENAEYVSIATLNAFNHPSIHSHFEYDDWIETPGVWDLVFDYAVDATFEMYISFVYSSAILWVLTYRTERQRRVGKPLPFTLLPNRHLERWIG